MRKRKLLTLIVAIVVAAAIPAIAFAGTMSLDKVDTKQALAILGTGGGPFVDIVAGLSSDDTQAGPAMMSAIESPANSIMQATEKSPVGAQAKNTTIGIGGSGGSTFHVGKVPASASMMTGESTRTASFYHPTTTGFGEIMIA